jgi:AraC family transcriptional regulator
MLEHATLFSSPVVRISDVGCRSSKGGCGELEAEVTPRLVLPRSGAFAYHFTPREEVVADANTAIALHPQMEFKVSHPIDGGDACTVFEYADESVLDHLRGVVTVGARAAFFGRLARSAALSGASPLAVEERAIACAGALSAESSRRTSFRFVERAKATIAQDPFDDRSLAEIASAAGVSPFHLTRSFRRVTGMSLHAYRMQLRLQRALERALEGETLARVAVDCGFAHHSHFTSAFRKHFGSLPSRLRKISTAS